MKVFFSQIYLQPGITFHFSHQFQQFISKVVTEFVVPSAYFVDKYGSDWNLMIRISAKKEIESTEIKGPSVFKKDHQVEYSVFLPFSRINLEEDSIRSALYAILEATEEILSRLQIAIKEFEIRKESIVVEICEQPLTYLKETKSLGQQGQLSGGPRSPPGRNEEEKLRCVTTSQR